MGRLVKGSVLGVMAACVLLGVAGVAPAFASSAWWHLGSSTRPTYLGAGQAKDEVWKLTMNASEGAFVVEVNGNFGVFGPNEAPSEVREGLEGLYGPCVKGPCFEVTGGPGPTPNVEYGTYEIRFVG